MAGTNIYNELVQAQLQNSTSDLSVVASGLIYLNTTSFEVKWYTNSAWKFAVDTTTAQTLTTKTFTSPLLTAGSTFNTTGAGTVGLFTSMGANTLTVGGASTLTSIPGSLTVSGTLTATIPLGTVSGILASANGGTGVNNAGTFTYGANNLTFTTTGVTSLTLPTSGTLVTTAATQTLDAKTLNAAVLAGDTLIKNAAGATPTLQYFEDPDNGTNKITTKAPDTLAADWTLTLPPDDGVSGQLLTTDGNGVTTWSTPAGSQDSTTDAKNYTLTATVGSSALTISLKTKAGAAPSGGDPVNIAFRSATIATGDYTVVAATAATSVVVGSGSTLGHRDGVEYPIYIYALNNAGTIELAVSSMLFDAGGVVSTTDITGAGSDSVNVMYSEDARTNVAFKLIGRMLSTQTTAGTWAAVPTNIALGGAECWDAFYSAVHVVGENGVGSSFTRVFRFVTTNTYRGADITLSKDTANGTDFTINRSGTYTISGFLSAFAVGIDTFIMKNSNTSVGAGSGNYLCAQQHPSGQYSHVSATVYLVAGDVIRFVTGSASPATGATQSDDSGFMITRCVP